MHLSTPRHLHPFFLSFLFEAASIEKSDFYTTCQCKDEVEVSLDIRRELSGRGAFKKKIWVHQRRNIVLSIFMQKKKEVRKFLGSRSNGKERRIEKRRRRVFSFFLLRIEFKVILPIERAESAENPFKKILPFLSLNRTTIIISINLIANGKGKKKTRGNKK